MEVIRRVVCAAEMMPDGVIFCGPRHYDEVMWGAIKRAGYPKLVIQKSVAGFIDQRGVFLSREEAWDVANGAGQIIWSEWTIAGFLHSEDLYTEVGQRVVCAALKLSDGVIFCGPRHYDATMRGMIARAGYERLDSVKALQGFVDQHGAFLSREDALKIAESTGQIIRRVGGDCTELFSENLY